MKTLNKKYKPSSFDELKNLISKVKLSEIDTSLITDMACLFYNVKHINGMFANCNAKVPFHKDSKLFYDVFY